MKHIKLDGANLGCPSCQRVLDGATFLGPGARMPRAGDLSVCAYCQTILAFQGEPGELSFRVLPVDEFIDLPIEIRSTLKSAQQHFGEIKRARDQAAAQGAST